ncbi:hypothetical protein NDS46_27170 [Paenibacillus thiaminolyticus]|uniref:hypothetical protein n=1 Tax=Paenibacillus thiaminolyticus TaxID=49283 RepID=UPI00232BB00A|nr:hypothetical protein [Paenibacillus thiaminolyticus]WCF11341.1 hypothetical protein NDS46_27170 [Paenibacillus thiaminolyticus]
MLLNYYRHHIDLNQLREEYPAPRGGYSLQFGRNSSKLVQQDQQRSCPYAATMTKAS